jgi:hypothetical protein
MSQQDAAVEVPVASTSIPLADLSLEQLVGLSQRFGRQIDELKAQRAYLAGKIAARIAAGERTCTDPVANPGALEATRERGGDAAAPGADVSLTRG